MVFGYLHAHYAQSLADFGEPCELPHSGGGILKRKVPNSPYYDAMGCYPLFCCKDWARLPKDLDQLEDDFVSLALVTDPFGGYDLKLLHHCFKNVVIPFKEHFVVDLSRPPLSFISNHHRRNAKKALKNVQFEKCDAPFLWLDDWVNLYDNLIRRHRISGIQAFSKKAFARQLRVPGLIMFRALHHKTTVGMLLWYIQGNTGYYHLGAFSDLGYQLGVSFALFWEAIAYFAKRNLRWLNLGAGAGITGNGEGGLTRFKRGWSNSTRLTYFCGRIFNRQKYEELLVINQISSTDYFPAYRVGEFV